MREIKVVLCYHVVVLMRVINVHIEDVTISTHILLMPAKIYYKLINEKLKEIRCNFFLENHDNRPLKVE